MLQRKEQKENWTDLSLLGQGPTFKGKKNNHSSVSDADREIPHLGSTNNAGNSVNLVSGFIRLPSGWVSLSALEIGDTCMFYFSV